MKPEEYPSETFCKYTNIVTGVLENFETRVVCTPIWNQWPPKFCANRDVFFFFLVNSLWPMVIAYFHSLCRLQRWKPCRRSWAKRAWSLGHAKAQSSQCSRATTSRGRSTSAARSMEITSTTRYDQPSPTNCRTRTSNWYARDVQTCLHKCCLSPNATTSWWHSTQTAVRSSRPALLSTVHFSRSSKSVYRSSWRQPVCKWSIAIAEHNTEAAPRRAPRCFLHPSLWRWPWIARRTRRGEYPCRVQPPQDDLQ